MEGAPQGALSFLAAALMGRLEQLDRIPVRILELNLLSAGSDLELVAKAHSAFLQGLNACSKIRHLKNHAIPPAGLLTAAIWHLPRTRSPGATQDRLEIRNRDLGDSGRCLSSNLNPSWFV